VGCRHQGRRHLRRLSPSGFPPRRCQPPALWGQAAFFMGNARNTTAWSCMGSLQKTENKAL
jgi:hypothetical protein